MNQSMARDCLLGSLIPIGNALESSGGTALIAQWISPREGRR